MTAASAVPRPSSGAAETAAATSPVDAIRFRRVRSWRFAGAPGSDVDEVIRIAFLGMMGCCDAGVARLWRRAVPSRAFTHAERACGCKPKHTYTRKQVNSFQNLQNCCDIKPACGLVYSYTYSIMLNS